MIQCGPTLWSAVAWCRLRMIAILSITRACRGNSSQSSMPGTLVAIGLNSPRNSLGASGFRSYVSMCDGPPPRKTWITAVSLDRLPRLAALRRRRSRSGSVRARQPQRARPGGSSAGSRRRTSHSDRRRCRACGSANLREASRDVQRLKRNSLVLISVQIRSSYPWRACSRCRAWSRWPRQTSRSSAVGGRA